MSAVIKPAQCGFRTVTLADLDEILPIERASYEFPWTEGVLRDCIENYFFSAWIEDGAIIAYGVLSWAVNEAHLLNLCVKPGYRATGLGRRVLHHLLETAERQRADTVFLEVRASNIIAIDLYLSEGFNEIGIRKAYYPAPGGREDAMVMAKAISLPAS